MSIVFDLAQIVLIDLSLAGDNALVIGMAVSGLSVERRNRAMTAGIVAATVLRIIMALFAVQLLRITGLLMAGGLLLLWVGWKMWREVRARKPSEQETAEAQNRKFSAAVWQIVIADVSMSLDNVLGVAGVAREHMRELVLGLVLSVALMGIASTQIAKLSERYPQVVYGGIAIILYTALRMIYDGSVELWPAIHGLFLRA